MEISKKQKQEIEFLSKEWQQEKAFEPTEDEITEFINCTVHGFKKSGNEYVGKFSQRSNRLSVAKRELEISASMWRKDLAVGMMSFRELVEDYPSEYFKRFIGGLCKSITREYRMKQLQETPRAEICPYVAIDNARRNG